MSAGQRALDVGCGTGSLTGELVARLGVGSVGSGRSVRSFVAARGALSGRSTSARRRRRRSVSVRRVRRATLAQLVVHFMRTRCAGLTEMRRRDTAGRRASPHASGIMPAATARSGCSGMRPGRWTRVVDDESRLPGTREGHLGRAVPGGGAAWRRPGRRCRSASSIRASTRGGIRSREASARPALLGRRDPAASGRDSPGRAATGSSRPDRDRAVAWAAPRPGVTPVPAERVPSARASMVNRYPIRIGRRSAPLLRVLFGVTPTARGSRWRRPRDGPLRQVRVPGAGRQHHALADRGAVAVDHGHRRAAHVRHATSRSRQPARRRAHRLRAPVRWSGFSVPALYSGWRTSRASRRAVGPCGIPGEDARTG